MWLSSDRLKEEFDYVARVSNALSWRSPSYIKGNYILCQIKPWDDDDISVNALGSCFDKLAWMLTSTGKRISNINEELLRYVSRFYTTDPSQYLNVQNTRTIHISIFGRRSA